jgi:hypothetical protein
MRSPSVQCVKNSDNTVRTSDRTCAKPMCDEVSRYCFLVASRNTNPGSVTIRWTSLDFPWPTIHPFSCTTPTAVLVISISCDRIGPGERVRDVRSIQHDRIAADTGSCGVC